MKIFCSQCMKFLRFYNRNNYINLYILIKVNLIIGFYEILTIYNWILKFCHFFGTRKLKFYKTTHTIVLWSFFFVWCTADFGSIWHRNVYYTISNEKLFIPARQGFYECSPLTWIPLALLTLTTKFINDFRR